MGVDGAAIGAIGVAILIGCICSSNICSYLYCGLYPFGLSEFVYCLKEQHMQIMFAQNIFLLCLFFLMKSSISWMVRPSKTPLLSYTQRSNMIMQASVDPANNEDTALFLENVEYFDMTSPTPGSPNARSLPLFLLDHAFYPQGYTFLNVFEMKYR